MDKKQLMKRIEKKCLICGETNYNILDVHRIVPGAEGGKYKEWNMVCLCSNCHRKVHAEEIVIKGKYNSTKGIIVHCFIDGKEYWKQ